MSCRAPSESARRQAAPNAQRGSDGALTGAAALGLAIWLLRGKDLSVLNRLCLALILGGALGNLYDRVVYDKVRDFIDVFGSDLELLEAHYLRFISALK